MWREITAGHPTSSAEDARALAEGDDDIYFRYTPLPTPSNEIESSSVRHYEHQHHYIYQASQYRRIGSTYLYIFRYTPPPTPSNGIESSSVSLKTTTRQQYQDQRQHYHNYQAIIIGESDRIMKTYDTFPSLAGRSRGSDQQRRRRGSCVSAYACRRERERRSCTGRG